MQPTSLRAANDAERQPPEKVGLYVNRRASAGIEGQMKDTPSASQPPVIASAAPSFPGDPLQASPHAGVLIAISFASLFCFLAVGLLLNGSGRMALFNVALLGIIAAAGAPSFSPLNSISLAAWFNGRPEGRAFGEPRVFSCNSPKTCENKGVVYGYCP